MMRHLQARDYVVKDKKHTVGMGKNRVFGWLHTCNDAGLPEVLQCNLTTPEIEPFRHLLASF